MTIDERIEIIMTQRYHRMPEAVNMSVKQLIQEVIEFVKPERPAIDYDQHRGTQVAGAEYNEAIDHMEAKIKELKL
jgi:hypothetical protein